jgi:serine/threonine protein kinase
MKQNKEPVRDHCKDKPSKRRQSINKGSNNLKMELSYFKDYGYIPIGEIGKGGYGTVYLATRLGKQTLYAIKLNIGIIKLETIYT